MSHFGSNQRVAAPGFPRSQDESAMAQMLIGVVVAEVRECLHHFAADHLVRNVRQGFAATHAPKLSNDNAGALRGVAQASVPVPLPQEKAARIAARHAPKLSNDNAGHCGEWHGQLCPCLSP